MHVSSPLTVTDRDAALRPKAVVCLSGGMDSTVCATLAARDFDVCALHFSYGQRTEARELQSALDVSRAIGAKDFMHLRIDLFQHPHQRIGGIAFGRHRSHRTVRMSRVKG